MGDLAEGTQEGQSPYTSGDIHVENVDFMTMCLSTARGPGTVCTSTQREPAQVESLGAQPSQKGTQPHSPSQTHEQFTCPLCLRKTTYQGTATSSVAAHQLEVHPGEGNSVYYKLGGALQKARRSNRYAVCHSCGDFHTNLSRYSSRCDRTLP